jgi:site-specific DNA-methyltransferase (adenine-specific)
MSNPKMYKYEWIWIKGKASNFLAGKKQPLKYTEEILVFYKNFPTYNPQMILKEEKNKRNNKKGGYLEDKTKNINSGKYSDRLKAGQSEFIYPRNWIKFGQEYSKFHPTQKPVALFEYLIKTYTNEGDLVLDNCAGSGTTGVACLNLNRNFILIEKEPEYVEVINNRINNLPTKLL